jgi:small multidrug resistance pump
MANDPCADESFAKYRPWFYAAAIYNFVWGAANILFPRFFFGLIGMPEPNYLALWQVVGMFVLAYAPAYWWAARYPARHRHLIVIGLLGKILGPVGFVWSVGSGQLPLAFGWTLLTNDLLWWPAFGLYLRDVARVCGGWMALLRGD